MRSAGHLTSRTTIQVTDARARTDEQVRMSPYWWQSLLPFAHWFDRNVSTELRAFGVMTACTCLVRKWLRSLLSSKQQCDGRTGKWHYSNIPSIQCNFLSISLYAWQWAMESFCVPQVPSLYKSRLSVAFAGELILRICFCFYSFLFIFVVILIHISTILI